MESFPVKSQFGQSFNKIKNQHLVSFFCTTILLHTFLYISIAFTQDNGSVSYHVSVEENGLTGTPTSFEVSQKYPNPFIPSTKIVYSVAEASNVRIVVYDVIKRELQILADGFKAAVNYELIFNAENLPSGLYLYTLEAGSTRITKKMTLLK